jgi:hypothetical protein
MMSLSSAPNVQAARGRASRVRRVGQLVVSAVGFLVAVPLIGMLFDVGPAEGLAVSRRPWAVGDGWVYEIDSAGARGFALATVIGPADDAGYWLVRWEESGGIGNATRELRLHEGASSERVVQEDGERRIRWWSGIPRAMCRRAGWDGEPTTPSHCLAALTWGDRAVTWGRGEGMTWRVEMREGDLVPARVVLDGPDGREVRTLVR